VNGWQFGFCSDLVTSPFLVRDLNFKCLSESKGAPITPSFGEDGITIVDPNRTGEGAAIVFQTIYGRAI